MDPDRHTNTQTDRQTDRHIYTLIILVRHPYYRCKKSLNKKTLKT